MGRDTADPRAVRVEPMDRTTTRAAFVSVLLHAALALLVLGMRPPPPPPAPPKAMEVHVVRFEDLPVAPPRTGNRRDPPTEETARIRRAETVPDPPVPGNVPARTGAPPGKPAARPRPAPSHPLPELPPLSPPAIPPADTLANAQPADLHLAIARLVDPAPPALPDRAQTQPATRPVAEEEVQMLERRFSDWTGGFDAQGAEKRMTWRHDGRTFTATMKHVPADDDTAPGRIVVRVSTEQDGETLSMEMRLRQLAFSSFAQFVDRWSPSVQIHDDAVDGRFHANSAIHLAYGSDAAPVFRGLVTLASRTIEDGSQERLRRDRLFPGGLKTGVKRIALPRNALPFPEDGILPEDAHRLARSARIVFGEDGSYRWTYLEGEASDEGTRRIDAGGHYIVGPEDGTLYVQGVVRGCVLVYAPGNIIIEGDLVYATFPPTANGDCLGLVADGSIEIADAEITGPGDLVIHGALYARRRLVVHGHHHAGARATLLVYGSVAAGSLGATEPRFATRIVFDPRLDAMRPPGFPLTDRYELEYQDREWKREAAPGGRVSM